MSEKSSGLILFFSPHWLEVYNCHFICHFQVQHFPHTLINGTALKDSCLSCFLLQCLQHITDFSLWSIINIYKSALDYGHVFVSCDTVASSTSTKQSDEPYGTWSVTELNPGDCVTCIVMYVLQTDTTSELLQFWPVGYGLTTSLE